MAAKDPSKIDVQGVTDTIGVPLPDPALTNGDTHAIFTLDDVLPHRQRSTPMATTLAAFASSDMFKSKASFQKPQAKRWDHRITQESAARHGSSLKGSLVHLKPGMISLGGGLPSSDYFPFETIDIKVPVPPQFSELETATTGQVASAGKHDVMHGKSQYDLNIALNYCQSTGAGQLLRFVTEHTELVHNPPYSDWGCSLTPGSTSALDVAFRTFASRGDYILTEEYSFSSALETARPLGLRLLGVKMDANGLLDSDLDNILSNWDASTRKAPKPFLLYIIPSGQNPTSSTQSLERRKDIYAVAEKHDLFILEDEPYYFLQMEPYVSGTIHNVPVPFEPVPIPQYLSSLLPSYLSLDSSGRVLRLDSFSKIVSPGARCGWLTGAAQIIERYIRASEVSTQFPSGFSMIVLYKLLDESWGHRGFLEWLMYLRAAYTRRRDVLVNACERHLPREVCSWVPPAAGMFHWIHLDMTRHPAYLTDASAQTTINSHAQVLELEDSVFMAAVRRNVLLSKGSWFRAQAGTDTEVFFRTTFAAASEDKIVEGIQRLGEALREEFLLGDAHHTNGHLEGRMNGHAK